MAKILVVEDNLDLLEILCTLLESEHEVLRAMRGEDAIRLADEERPDLVILDLQLPVMDGVQAGLWIKRLYAPDEVPILVLTALAGTGDAETVLASGCCDAYLAKPATLDAIREKVVELLDGAARRAA